MTRPSIDDTWLAVARMLQHRATCVKRQVGCVLTDIKGRVLSTGYNGTPAGLPHCTSQPCVGADQAVGSDTCQAVHAEINALIQCSSADKIHTCYTTVFPCNNCMKSLLNTNCQRIVYHEEHATSDTVKERWLAAGREILKIKQKDIFAAAVELPTHF